MLCYRIPLAVPTLYLKAVAVPAKLLSASMQLLQLFSCLVLPWTAAFRFSRGDHSLHSGRRHKRSQNNSAAEKHRSWSLRLGRYRLCKELKQLQKAGLLQCEMGQCSTLGRGLASLLTVFLTCVLIRTQRIASAPHPALPEAWLSLPACPFSHLETALRIPEVFHKEESHAEAPLLNLETINQSWSEAETISSVLRVQFTATEGPAAARVQTAIASLSLLPGEGTRTNQTGNNPNIM